MYHYGAKSTERLAECSSNIQMVFNEAIKHRDISIFEGYRSNERQQELLDEDPPKTKLGPGQSKHNQQPSMAVDAVPYPMVESDWEDREFWVEWTSWLKGFASGLGVTLVSGYDWDNDYDLDDQSFYDGPHFEEP